MRTSKLPDSLERPALHRRLRRPDHGPGREGPGPAVAGEARRDRAGGPLRQPHRPTRLGHRGPQPAPVRSPHWASWSAQCASFSCESSACEHASLLPLRSLARIRFPLSPRRDASSRLQPPILRDGPSRNQQRSTNPQMPPPQAAFESCLVTPVLLDTVQESSDQ